jgi:periplasmic protein TonB
LPKGAQAVRTYYCPGFPPPPKIAIPRIFSSLQGVGVSTVRAMALTKETSEGKTNTPTVPVTNNRPKTSDRMRADAVSLEVPVKVHGTRVQEAPSGAASGEAFEENTSTMIVFPQGGVLKMTTPVAPAQMMVVTNLKSGHDSICRVVKVRAYAQGQSYVEIEFTHRQPGYWGVYFPSDGPEASGNSAPVAAPISLDVKVEKPAEKPAIETAAVKPIARTRTPKSAVAKPDSVFAPLGSQEPVQPAAAATSSRRKPSSGAEPADKPASLETTFKGPALDMAPAASLSSLPGAEVRSHAHFSFAGAGVPGEIVEAPEADTAPPATPLAAPLGRLAAAASFGADAATARESFGTTLSSSTFGVAGAPKSSQAKGKHPMFAVGAVALVALAVGAAHHFLMPRSEHLSTAQLNSPPPPPAALTLPSASAPPRTAPEPAQQAAQAPVKTDSAPAAAKAETTPARVKVAPAAPAPAAGAAEEKALLASLQAHPASPKRAGGAAPVEPAPEIDSSAVDGDTGLSTIAGSSPMAPSTGDAQPVRIRVGGALRPPRLLSSVLPLYPAMARETGIEGDVVIDTTIDKTGRVTDTKVISGPSMLREAALDAVRQWKYEPSKLNGEPVPVQMTVTVKFHRN